ncbi:hypothetical protein VST7929_00034 [Vibrio stylophorae]|uniref:Uncharacterized protein n=1 Tax=Vibrio stylophorae TaxID=659351 RepID=A0ABN8DP74_9VIBR|nr:Tm-1-like ATP-binding domain-containing protein [Vibrio stylophorae]CAH0532223.1 hypothetical protein VST7929_00034 [Vibrio stylophorae]
MTPKCIYIASTFDTKAEEVYFIEQHLDAQKLSTKTVDLSTRQHTHSVRADISNATVASFHPDGAAAVFSADRGTAIAAMSLAFQYFLKQSQDIAALIGLGGSGGSAIITPAMQDLPIGLPKLMVSTMASGNTAGYVGCSDIAMLYPITDIAGINTISRVVLSNAAHAIAGQVKFAHASDNSPRNPDKPALGMTMFGVTTPCVEQIKTRLDEDYDCLIFHATGNGGKAMEQLAQNQLIHGMLDLTTTEICDHLFDGVLACDERRLDAVIETQLPYVGSCGALDMINFGAPDTIPAAYQDRLFYQHNAQVTLMRTNAKECAQLGQWIAQKLNQCQGEVRFLIPEKGLSALDQQGQLFWNPEADQALFDALEAHLAQTPSRQLIRLPYHINDPEFAEAVVAQFHQIQSLY